MIDCCRAGTAAEQGDGPIGLVLAASVYLLGITIVIQAALGYYAYQVLQSSAQEGAVVAARFGGNSNDGTTLTDQLIAESARSLVTDWSTTAEVVEAVNLTEAVGVTPLPPQMIVVTVRASVVGPLGQWQVQASGVAPIEAVDRRRVIGG